MMRRTLMPLSYRERVATPSPGEGLRPIDRTLPLTPPFSQGERLSFAVKAHDGEKEPVRACGEVEP
jgi:hypothetical protein